MVVCDGFAAEGGNEVPAVVLEVGGFREEGFEVGCVDSRVSEPVVVEGKEEAEAELVGVLEEAVDGVGGPGVEMVFMALNELQSMNWKGRHTNVHRKSIQA